MTDHDLEPVWSGSTGWTIPELAHGKGAGLTTYQGGSTLPAHVKLDRGDGSLSPYYSSGSQPFGAGKRDAIRQMARHGIALNVIAKYYHCDVSKVRRAIAS